MAWFSKSKKGAEGSTGGSSNGEAPAAGKSAKEQTTAAIQAKREEPPAKPQPPVAAQPKPKAAAASAPLSAHLGEMLLLLMKSPQHARLTLRDMQWLVLPALATGQYAMARPAKSAPLGSPLALVLWASVSNDVHERLQKTPGLVPQLKGQEWRSGDHPWVVAALGDKRAVEGILGQLHHKAWKKRTAMAYGRGKDGKPMVVKIRGRTSPEAK